MNINTPNHPWRKLYGTNTTSSAALAVPAVTLTAPSGDGVRTLAESPNAVAMMFYAVRTAADNETFAAMVIGWRRVVDGSVTTWLPTPLLSLNLVIGTMTGVATGTPLNTEYVADTITEAATLIEARQIVSPANNTVAYARVDTLGCELLQVLLSCGSGGTRVASCNALVAAY